MTPSRTANQCPTYGKGLRLTDRRPLAEYAGMLSKTSVKAMRKAIDEARRDRRALDVRT